EAGALQRLGERDRLRRRRGPVAHLARSPRALRPVRPDELLQRRALVAESERSARVRDRGFDLAAVPDDALVAQQALDVTIAEPRNALGIEAGERRAKVLALAQDRQPGQSGLKAFEAQPFVQ